MYLQLVGSFFLNLKHRNHCVPFPLLHTFHLAVACPHKGQLSEHENKPRTCKEGPGQSACEGQKSSFCLTLRLLNLQWELRLAINARSIHPSQLKLDYCWIFWYGKLSPGYGHKSHPRDRLSSITICSHLFGDMAQNSWTSKSLRPKNLNQLRTPKVSVLWANIPLQSECIEMYPHGSWFQSIASSEMVMPHFACNGIFPQKKTYAIVWYMILCLSIRYSMSQTWDSLLELYSLRIFKTTKIR